VSLGHREKEETNTRWEGGKEDRKRDKIPGEIKRLSRVLRGGIRYKFCPEILS